MKERDKELLNALVKEKALAIAAFILFLVMLGVSISRGAVFRDAIQLITQLVATALLLDPDAWSEIVSTCMFWTRNRRWTVPVWAIRVFGILVAISNFVMFLQGGGRKLDF